MRPLTGESRIPSCWLLLALSFPALRGLLARGALSPGSPWGIGMVLVSTEAAAGSPCQEDTQGQHSYCSGLGADSGSPTIESRQPDLHQGFKQGFGQTGLWEATD